MNEAFKIILTSFITIIGGVVVYALGRIIEKFFIKPIFNFKKTVGKIADSLIFYANIYSNPSISSDDEKENVSKVLRSLSSELNARISSVPYYNVFAIIKILPKKTDSFKASTSLIGLSNALFHNDYDLLNNKRDVIKICLKISF